MSSIRPEINKLIVLLKDSDVEDWTVPNENNDYVTVIENSKYPEAMIYSQHKGSHHHVWLKIKSEKVDLESEELIKITHFIREKLDARDKEMQQKEAKEKAKREAKALEYLR